jgi:hypothetical protein
VSPLWTVAGLLLLTTGTAGLAIPLTVMYTRHRNMPIPTDWTPAELAATTIEMRAWRGPTCAICGGRHCAGCAEPARNTATHGRHSAAQHSFDRIPADLRYVLSLATTVERARELARQCDPLRHRVWQRLAHTTRRAGRPTRLARLSYAGRLP